MLAICVLASRLFLWPAVAAAAEEPDDLRALVATALEQNPELRSIEAQVDALEHKVVQAGAWSHPKLAMAYKNVPVDSFALGEEAMSMAELRIEQTVPFFGKTDDREGVVRHQVEAKRWELDENRNRLRALVKTVYYKLALARQLRKITEEHVELVEQLIDAVRIKYEVGRAAQHDLLRLEVLRDRLTDDIEDFDREDKELSAALNATLHRDVALRIVTPATFETVAPSGNVPALLGLAIDHRPALKQLAETTQMYRAAADLARFEAVPDPTFFASYGLREEVEPDVGGRDLVTFGVSVPLPIFYTSRNAAQAEESFSKGRATEARRDALVDAIASGLADAFATWSREASKVRTYVRNLVPGARSTLDATFAAYQVDRASFLTLFEAELELLEFERTIRTARVRVLTSQATIEWLVGKELQ